MGRAAPGGPLPFTAEDLKRYGEPRPGSPKRTLLCSFGSHPGQRLAVAFEVLRGEGTHREWTTRDRRPIAPNGAYRGRLSRYARPLGQPELRGTPEDE